jgi:hypothetical protein
MSLPNKIRGLIHYNRPIIQQKLEALSASQPRPTFTLTEEQRDKRMILGLVIANVGILISSYYVSKL